MHAYLTNQIHDVTQRGRGSATVARNFSPVSKSLMGHLHGKISKDTVTFSSPPW
jgi:hypothetical protein